jgi:N-acetylglutamate synthase-like GNAT family acetyltransferase
VSRVVTRVAIRDAGADDVPAIRRLFEAYAASIGVDLCFQGFADELASLPGAYQPPRGALLVALHDAEAIGCVALRPLPDEGEHTVGEVKRLYVSPRARGAHAGRALMDALLERARMLGYDTLKLDTLATMARARSLYAVLGFRECAPYYRNPLPGVTYMSLTL